MLLSNQQIEQNRSSLREVAVTCERFGISDRAGAAIATAALKAFGIVTDTNKTNVIDPSKLRRERKNIDKKFKKIKNYNLERLMGFILMEERMLLS